MSPCDEPSVCVTWMHHRWHRPGLLSFPPVVTFNQILVTFLLCALSLSLCLSPILPHPFLSPPINEAADTPDLLTQLLQDLFFATNLQQLESRGMRVNFVCVIWWQVRLNQAPSGWMRGVPGNGIWGTERWTGNGRERKRELEREKERENPVHMH